MFIFNIILYGYQNWKYSHITKSSNVDTPSQDCRSLSSIISSPDIRIFYNLLFPIVNIFMFNRKFL